MATDQANQVGISRGRYGWRLRILLGLNLLLLVLLIVSRLDQSQLKQVGPWGRSVYDVFNPPAIPELRPSGRRLMAEVKALGGKAQRMEHTARFLGLFGGTETFHIELIGADIGDADLARLVQQHGDLRFHLLQRDLARVGPTHRSIEDAICARRSM